MLHRCTVEVGYSDTMIRGSVFHSHTDYEIYYFHQGKCTYLIGDQIYMLAPGDLILMHGMTLHCPNVDTDFPYQRTIIHFNAEYARSMLQPPFALNVLEPFERLRNHRFRLTEDEQLYVQQILRQMEYQQNKGGVGYYRLHALFLDFLYYIYELSLKPMQDQLGNFSQKERYVQQVLDYVEHHYQEDIDLDTLEEHIHISKYYLTKVFKEVTGSTIFNYLYQKRVYQARILFILEKGVSVSDACYRTGFKNPAHFSRLFKQWTGLSPDQFRKTSNKPICTI